MGHQQLKLIFLFATSTAFLGCNAKFHEIEALGALTGEMKTVENLSTLCGRPIDKKEVQGAMAALGTDPKAQKGHFIFSNGQTLSSTKQDGHATVDVSYLAEDGVACNGTLTFDFHKETTAKQYTRKVATYSSTYELTNLTVTKR